MSLPSCTRHDGFPRQQLIGPHWHNQGNIAGIWSKFGARTAGDLHVWDEGIIATCKSSIWHIWNLPKSFRLLLEQEEFSINTPWAPGCQSLNKLYIFFSKDNGLNSEDRRMQEKLIIVVALWTTSLQTRLWGETPFDLVFGEVTLQGASPEFIRITQWVSAGANGASAGQVRLGGASCWVRSWPVCTNCPTQSLNKALHAAMHKFNLHSRTLTSLRQPRSIIGNRCQC